LDTDSGDDDILCGEYNTVLSDVLGFHDLEKLPEKWAIEKADMQIEDGVITVVGNY
jgi:hypothetical protein